MGSAGADSVVERLNRRAHFDRLRAHATTLREGPLRIAFVDPDCDAGPHGAAIGFSVPRSYGSAVQRNRLRRRLREILREAERVGALPQRWYLVSVAGTCRELGYAELRRWLTRALARVDQLGADPGGSGQAEPDR